MDGSLCNVCAELSVTRLERLLGFAQGRGVDTVTHQFTSREVCQRGWCTRRYDVSFPLPPAVASQQQHQPLEEAAAAAAAAPSAEQPRSSCEKECENELATELDSEWEAALGTREVQEAEAQAWARLHASIDSWARPILDEVFGTSGDGAPCETPGAGCVLSIPGARAQSEHRDGPDLLINAFVPLIDLTQENGPTALVPRSHLRRGQEGRRVAPLLRKGQLLLYDYRLVHAGMPNSSDSTRPIGYVTYAPPGGRDTHNFPPSSLRQYCTRVGEEKRRIDATMRRYAEMECS